ncbi:MAG: hypothetical protein P8Y80_13900 [Acidobacteriota bacterium]
MRKALLLLAVLGWTSSLWAADPIIGTWKLNIEKSERTKNPPNLTPIELVEIYREADANHTSLERTGIMMDGSPISGKYLWPNMGGNVTITEDVPELGATAIIQTMISRREWFATFFRDGEQFMVIHKIVSKEGNTMHQRFKMITEQGKVSEWVQVYDRQ